MRSLNSPEAAYLEFINQMTQATKTIDVATFIFEPCHPSVQVLMDILSQKAQSGVKVRVLLDGFQQSDEQLQNMAAYFAKNKIQFSAYNGGKINPNIGFRMHTKLMVVDSARYIAGGRNLSDPYFAMDSNINYVDQDLSVTGPAALEAQATFNDLWAATATSRVPAKTNFIKWDNFCRKDNSARRLQISNYFKTEAVRIETLSPVRTCSNVHFSGDLSDFVSNKYSDTPANQYAQPDSEFMTPMRLRRKLSTQAVLNFVNNTQSDLKVVNWVYIPMGFLDDAFANLRNKQITVRALTNEDMEDGPEFFKQSMEYTIKNAAIEDSVGSERVALVSSKGSMGDRYALTPKTATFFIHAKDMVRDGKDAIVGSFNIDPRSYNTNLEAVTTLLNCPTITRDIQASFNVLKQNKINDVNSGQIPVKPEPSFGAKMFAALSYMFF